METGTSLNSQTQTRKSLTSCLLTCLCIATAAICIADSVPIIVTGGGTSLQTAIDTAPHGSTIHVYRGMYTPIQTHGKMLFIRAIEGVDKTIIDGNYTNRCATLSSTSYDQTASTNTIIDGFSLLHGYVSPIEQGVGGGVHGGIIQNCIISDCEAFCGGGASDAILRNTKISNCIGTNYGGGACNCDLENCLIVQNYGGGDSGGLYRCFAINCTIALNHVEHVVILSYNDGIYWGAGATCAGATDCLLRNCIIWGNVADECRLNFENDALIFNVPMNYSASMLEKCFTMPIPKEDLLYAGVMDGKKTTGWDKNRKILCKFELAQYDESATPRFVGEATGNYRLRFDSPCIDTGKNVELWKYTDVAGNSRIVGNAIDIGCYEFQRKIDITSNENAAIIHASVPMDFLDNDAKPLLAANNGDYEATARAMSANNINTVWECYVAGISPTNAMESFRTMISISNGLPCVSWSPNLNTTDKVRTYTVMGMTNLTDNVWVSPTNSAHRFFKVIVEMP